MENITVEQFEKHYPKLGVNGYNILGFYQLARLKKRLDVDHFVAIKKSEDNDTDLALEFKVSSFKILFFFFKMKGEYVFSYYPYTEGGNNEFEKQELDRVLSKKHFVADMGSYETLLAQSFGFALEKVD